MKEMLIILKIAFALYKEIDMQEKLLKHRNIGVQGVQTG